MTVWVDIAAKCLKLALACWRGYRAQTIERAEIDGILELALRAVEQAARPHSEPQEDTDE